MSCRYFTADFHLGMELILKFAKRGTQHGGKFQTVKEMDKAIITSCFNAKPDDIIIHAGDFCQYSNDRGTAGRKSSPAMMMSQIPATFVNIKGNHDASNRVKSICDSMQIHLGKRFRDVTVGHYPSYDKRAASYAKNGWINLCGHVHQSWKHCLDIEREILNINIGVDVWDFKIVSEDELIKYIEKVLYLPKSRIFTTAQMKLKNGELENE